MHTFGGWGLGNCAYWRVFCALLMVGFLFWVNANDAASQGLAPLTTTTPQYKCHVHSVEDDDSIIQFHSRVELPPRFSDVDTFERAPVPDSVRREISAIYECVRMPDQFSDPSAVALERRSPK